MFRDEPGNLDQVLSTPICQTCNTFKPQFDCTGNLGKLINSNSSTKISPRLPGQNTEEAEKCFCTPKLIFLLMIILSQICF